MYKLYLFYRKLKFITVLLKQGNQKTGQFLKLDFIQTKAKHVFCQSDNKRNKVNVHTRVVELVFCKTNRK